MTRQLFQFLPVALAAVWSWSIPSIANSAEAFPTQPIRLIVPYSPGGSADILGRTLGRKVGELLGQNVIVENKPGAGTAIGARFVAGAPADGYTLMMGTVSSHAMTPLINPSAGYDPIRDFVPIAPVASIPFALLVNNDLPARTLEEFLALAKERPGKLTYASAGVGTSNHLAAELLAAKAGLEMVHVPYKGSAPALADLLGGQVDAMFDLLATAVQQVKAGKARALAVTSVKPSKLLDGVPSFAQHGMPDYVVSAWFGVFAPANTPAPVVAKLNDAVNRAIATADIGSQLEAMGADALVSDPAAFRSFVSKEYETWKSVVAGAKITAR